MARRFNDPERAERDAHARHRDGDLCLACFAERGEDPGPLLEPTLDHLDGNKRNNAAPNIIRLCRPHNSAEENRVRPARRAWRKASVAARAKMPPIWTRRIVNPATYPGLVAAAAEIIRKRPGMENFGKPSGARGEGRGERKAGEPELIARGGLDHPEADRDTERARILQDLMNPLYRLWVFNEVKQHGSITKADAILSGAEYVDDETGRGAKKTILDYFDKITSRTGWLREVRNDAGRLVWEFREGRDLEALQHKLQGRVKTLRDLLNGGPA